MSEKLRVNWSLRQISRLGIDVKKREKGPCGVYVSEFRAALALSQPPDKLRDVLRTRARVRTLCSRPPRALPPATRAI